MDDINNSGLTPGFIFVVIPSKRDTEVTDHRDSAAMYFIGDAPSHTEPAKCSAIELSVEVTPEFIEDDPFDEIELNYEPSSERGECNLDQLQSYATRVFDQQQRTHHFSIIFFGSMPAAALAIPRYCMRRALFEVEVSRCKQYNRWVRDRSQELSRSWCNTLP
ncbi:hypothetical protein C8Q74DRAFT_931061 [Fomes fomentarius]|nr:hypothetical protein C8Q74DRAFT_931061 [Fomes fomentarius]